jgi:hypothetical protein
VALADLFMRKLNEAGSMSREELVDLAVKQGFFPDAENAMQGIHPMLVNLLRSELIRELPNGTFAPPTLSQAIKLRRTFRFPIDYRHSHCTLPLFRGCHPRHAPSLDWYLIALTGDYRVARVAFEEAVKRRPGRIEPCVKKRVCWQTVGQRIRAPAEPDAPHKEAIE